MRRKRIVSRKKYADGMSSPFPPTPPTPAGGQYTIYDRGAEEPIGTVTSVKKAVNLIQATDTPKKLVIQGTDTIAENSFKDCTNLAEVHLPQETVSIGDSAFKNSGLESISLPSNLTTIGSEAFSGTSLVNVTIPETITTIGENAFAETESLQEMNLDSHYNDISGFPWGSDDVLTTYNWLKTTQYEVYNYETNELLGVYNDLNSAITAIKGNTKEVLMVCPYGLETIGGRAEFQNCSLLKRIFLPSTLTTIPAPGFYGASGLVIGHIPRSVAIINTHLFVDCTSLKKVFIGSPSVDTSSQTQYFSNNINLEYAYVCSSNVNKGFLANVRSQTPSAKIIFPNVIQSVKGMVESWNNVTIDCLSLTDVNGGAFNALTGSTVNLPSLVRVAQEDTGSIPTIEGTNLVINIGDKLESIGTNSLFGVKDSTINIDLPQDAIAGAPWGATNTTVNWRG